MTGCAPSLAQALLPYPAVLLHPAGRQREPRQVHLPLAAGEGSRSGSRGGTFLARLLHAARSSSRAAPTTSRRDAITWSGASGVISPFEKDRNQALAADDVDPRPLGGPRLRASRREGQEVPRPGRRGQRPARRLAAQHGLPLLARASRSSSGPASATCPASSAPGCIPAVKAGANLFAQDKGSFDPNKGPLFNKDAFESVDAFNFYYGTGARVTSYSAASSYRNQDLSLVKNTQPRRGRQPPAAHRGLQRLELAHLQRVAGNASAGRLRLQHRPGQPRLRQVEREREQPADHPGRGAPGVLARRDS